MYYFMFPLSHPSDDDDDGDGDDDDDDDDDGDDDDLRKRLNAECYSLRHAV